MSKMKTIIRREYAEVVKKKSFLIGILVTPLLIGLWMFFPTLLMRNSETAAQRYVVVDLDNQGFAEPIAKVLSDLMTSDSVPQYAILGVESFAGPNDSSWLSRRAEIDQQVQKGDIDGALVIYPDLIVAESLLVISKSFDFKALSRAERGITRIISAERLDRAHIGVPADSIHKLTRRVDISVVSPTGKKKDFRTLFFGMVLFAMLMFMLIFNYGQLLMRAVIEEKNTRVMEVIISSVSPFELMFGKIIGLGAAALTQVAIWGVLGLAVRYFMASDTLTPEIVGSVGAVFSPVFVCFFLLYLVSGFLLYSAIFAIIGAIVNTDKEAQNFMSPIIMLFVLPFMLAPIMVSSTNSSWMIGLSMFPLTAPQLMIMRLSVAAPEVFTFSDPLIMQASIGVVLTALGAVGMSWLAARIFRVGILMYGKRPTFPEIVRWVGRS